MNKCGFNSYKNPCIYLIKGCCTSPVICKYKMADDIDKDAEIARLTAENDKLQKRLDNAVELPCLVGDTIYCIHGMSNPIIKDWKVQEIIITDHNFVVICGHPETEGRKVEVSDHYKEWWFTDRVAAETRLAELKGERK